MTREDFVAAVETLGNTVDMARYLERLDEIFACYDAQRAEIERQAEHIKRLEERTWTDNVQFLAAAKENLLQQYVNLTTMHGEQKHTIRGQAKEIERFKQLTTMQDGGIRSLHKQIARQDEEIAKLTGIVRLLTTGECGSLLKARFPVTLQQAMGVLK